MYEDSGRKKRSHISVRKQVLGILTRPCVVIVTTGLTTLQAFPAFKEAFPECSNAFSKYSKVF